MILFLIIFPIFCGITCFFIKRDSVCKLILVFGAVSHFFCSLLALVFRPSPCLKGMVYADSTGLLFLCLTSLLFLASSIYAVGYMSGDHKSSKDNEEGFIFINAPRNIFTGCLLIFCGTMTIVCTAQHFGLLWIGIEATTFASAPLIYYHHHHRSLEATWKYVMICSVGIGFSLVGNLLLLVSSSVDGGHGSLLFSDLEAGASSISAQWLKAAFIFFLVGYGTKTGLAPMHTWLPTAHSESPAFVSSLLSGALLNCAFLGIFRIHKICYVSGLSEFSGGLLIFFGLLSIVVAAFFIIGQKDYKRMLAYSSVEHMGIIALGTGLGGVALFAAMLHLVNHSLTKGMLFLTSGNILSVFGSRRCAEVRGVLRKIPASGFLWTAGFFAITGVPPFGLFISEFLIFKTSLQEHKFLTAGIFIVFLSVIFAAMSHIMLEMVLGKSDGKQRESLYMILPPAVLCGLTLFLGVYIPGPLSDFIGKIVLEFLK